MENFFMDCDVSQRTELLLQVGQENQDFAEVEKQRVENESKALVPKTNLYEENNRIKSKKQYFKMMPGLCL